MAIENTPTEGLTLDQAFAQLKASRQPAPQEEQLEDDNEEVVDNAEEFEEDLDEVSDSDDDSELEEDDDLETSDEEEEEDTSADEEIFEVEVEGELQEVSGEELVKGYLRHNDYTRKRQADAKAARELEEAYTTKLSQLDQALAANVSAEEQQLKVIAQQYQQATDEATKQSLHYQYLQLQQSVQARSQQLTHAQQLKAQQEQAVKEAEYTSQMKLIQEQFEDWDTKAPVLQEYLTNLGVSDFSKFVDVNLMILADKAKQFDDLQQTRETVVKKKLKRKVPATLKPGQGEKRFNINKQKEKSLANQFRSSGNINDAMALLRARKGQ